MANKRGWWKIVITNSDDDGISLSDVDLEHIAECIKQGYQEGEICKDEESEDA